MPTSRRLRRRVAISRNDQKTGIALRPFSKCHSQAPSISGKIAPNYDCEAGDGWFQSLQRSVKIFDIKVGSWGPRRRPD